MSDSHLFQMFEYLHEKAKELTGDPWCPYPSRDFLEAIMRCDDSTAKMLIEKRRQYLFPDLLMGEPMQTEIDAILNKETQ